MRLIPILFITFTLVNCDTTVVEPNNRTLVKHDYVADSTCASGTGLILMTGEDVNANGILDPNEILQNELVCNVQHEPTQLIDVINPCGESGSGVDEILFRLSSGTLIAWYRTIGLVVLTPGNYYTTDSDMCFFVVNDDLTVTW